MNKTILVLGVVTVVALAGCAGFSGGDQQDPDNGVTIGDNTSGATNVTQSVSIEVNETTAGEELTEIGATYPRDDFVVRAAQHDQVALGVDSDGDGDLERTFNETHVSGVNNNAYSYDVTLDTNYTLETGDAVVVEYPTIDNPEDAGEYTVEMRLNDRQTVNATVRIE